MIFAATTSSLNMHSKYSLMNNIEKQILLREDDGRTHIKLRKKNEGKPRKMSCLIGKCIPWRKQENHGDEKEYRRFQSP
jgi:hypothetical protein